MPVCLQLRSPPSGSSLLLLRVNFPRPSHYESLLQTRHVGFLHTLLDTSCGPDKLVSRAATLSAALLVSDSYTGGALALLLSILCEVTRGQGRCIEAR
jgi:hypothetical protein